VLAAATVVVAVDCLFEEEAEEAELAVDAEVFVGVGVAEEELSTFCLSVVFLVSVVGADEVFTVRLGASWVVGVGTKFGGLFFSGGGLLRLFCELWRAL
jgi:hypothetical protein